MPQYDVSTEELRIFTLKFI